MKLIVKQLEIRNFKVFDKLELDIESEHLVVLDGPNGFGKSSFFDAIELLLTGKIRRYIELEELTIDRRSLKTGCPWLFREAKKDDWLSIRAEIIIDGASYFLERAASKTFLDGNRGLADLKIPLYELLEFNAERGEAISQEQSYLSNLLGFQYQRDFELFHYVEQEENTRLLKQKEKDRQSQIAHLFDIGVIQEKINNINAASIKISKLCNAQKSLELKKLKDKWFEAKQQLLPAGSSVSYERLITITDQPWDLEVVEVDVHQFEQWLSVDGELFRVSRFIENFEQYENQLYNNELIRNLIPKRELQQRFLMYYRLIEQKDKCQDDVACYESAVALNDAFNDTIKAINEDRLVITGPLVTLLPEYLSLDEFHRQVAELKLQLDNSDRVQKCYAALLQTREQMVSAFREHQSHCDLTTICPTCGHTWPTSDDLLKAIEDQRISLEFLAKLQNDQFSLALADFRRNWQRPIEIELQTCLAQQKEIIERKRQLIRLSDEQILWLENYNKRLQDSGVSFQDLMCESFDSVNNIDTDKLELRIRELLRTVDDSLIHDDFERIFRDVFNNDTFSVKSITPSKIELKKVYLVQQQYTAKSKYITECELEYNNAELIYKRAEKLKDHLQKIKRIYESEKRLYLESIVKEIEILFHIYTGRLMQSYQQGLGVFIENDGNSIAFNETPGHAHDAVFSMSSGQLSALVLSFTLALNKRYAKHSLLLIDDPVQTLDEINVAGFVELLRTEFRDRQIIMSTHEDRMSAYFRYKYKKFGMPAGRINFMEASR